MLALDYLIIKNSKEMEADRGNRNYILFLRPNFETQLLIIKKNGGKQNIYND